MIKLGFESYVCQLCVIGWVMMKDNIILDLYELSWNMDWLNLSCIWIVTIW